MTGVDGEAGNDIAGDITAPMTILDDLLSTPEDDRAARRGRRWGRIAVRVAVGLLALLVFGGVGVLWNVTRTVTASVHTVPVGGLPPVAGDPGGTPMTVLLLGSDLRAGPDARPDVLGQRADAIMLIRFSADRSRIDVLSIPRDSWVSIPGRGTAKVNASLNGGPGLVVQTVRQLTGIPIDHVMLMDFAGVRDLTTALGGVTVVNERASTDPRNGRTFAAGPLTLSGEAALDYVRQRYGLPHGDFDRIERQQQLISAISQKLKSADLVGSPLLVNHVVHIVADSLTVDAGLTPELMTKVLLDVVSTPGQGIHFYTAPVGGLGRSPDGQDYVDLDMPKLAAACLAMRTDRPIPLKSTPIKLP